MSTRKIGGAIRYASGATGINFEKWLTWGVIATGVYFAWKTYRGIADAGDAASRTVADTYVRLTSDGPVEVLGRVVLPNGQKVPLANIQPKSDFTFVYGGVRYRLTKRRADNDYDSVRV
jgi:hypothetical protein